MSSINNNTVVPMASGNLPLIGHLAAFGINTDAFVEKNQKTPSGVFRFRLQGRDVVMLSNPHDVEAWYGKSKYCTTDAIHEENSVRGFLMTSDSFHKTFDEQIEIIRDCVGKKNLDEYNARMQDALEEHLLSLEGGGDWKEEASLLDWVGAAIFFAGSRALFGRAKFSAQAYRDFADFDKASPLLFAGWPNWVARKGVKARQAVIDALKVARFAQDRPPLVDRRHALFAAKGLSNEQFAATDLTLFWAANANTILMTFWNVLYARFDSASEQAIRADIAWAIAQGGEATPAGLPRMTKQRMDGMLNVESFVNETMRLFASSATLRDVSSDVQLPLHSGDTLYLDVGDRVMCYTRLTHLSEAVFSDAARFKWDRFLGNPDFFFADKKVATPVRPFGGGANICPGRFFSVNEFRIALLTILMLCDIELLDGVPPHDPARTTMGSLMPTKPVRFRWRLRASAPKMG